MYAGQSVKRVDAFDKVTGRSKYTDDLCDRGAYIARVLHSTIANGRVVSIDTSEAEKVPGVVRILTCFDLKEKHYFPTAGHPWSTDPSHQDVADRLILTDRVRFAGDDIAAVVAEDEVAASQALRLIRVEYEEYPFVLDVQKAMEDGAPLLHEEYPNNILKHTQTRLGDYQKAIQEPGLIKVEGWYETPVVQHCHIENFICYAFVEGGRVNVVTSTQIPHIVRRTVGQALGIDWGRVRVVKPYIGGGFGNKQDVLYEPLCAWLSLQTGGHLVKLDVPREETFICNRTRHSIRNHIVSWVRPDGTFAARKLEAFSDQGAYASHGHSICAKGAGAFPQLYPCENVEVDAYTIFTNNSKLVVRKVKYVDKDGAEKERTEIIPNTCIDYNVKMFNTYNYTLFAPDNTAMSKAYAEGLPKWSDVVALYNKYPQEEEHDISAAEKNDMETAKKMIRQIRDFIRYHFVTNSVYADNHVDGGRFLTIFNAIMSDVPADLASMSPPESATYLKTTKAAFIILNSIPSNEIEKVIRGYKNSLAVSNKPQRVDIVKFIEEYPRAKAVFDTIWID